MLFEHHDTALVHAHPDFITAAPRRMVRTGRVRPSGLLQCEYPIAAKNAVFEGNWKNGLCAFSCSILDWVACAA